jgi:hypothetical protein
MMEGMKQYHLSRLEGTVPRSVNANKADHHVEHPRGMQGLRRTVSLVTLLS